MVSRYIGIKMWIEIYFYITLSKIYVNAHLGLLDAYLHI